MTRWLILPQARPILLLALLSIAAAPAALAQDATTQERLDRLERDLSMLQRQVYRGPDGEAPAAGGGSDAAVDTQVRMDRLEQQMRDLTGRVENETNEVEQLRQRLEQINSDIDVRLNQGPGGQGGQEPGTAPPPRHASAGPAAADEAQSGDDPAALGAYRRPGPPAALSSPDQASYGTLTPPGAAPAGPTEGAPYQPYPSSTGPASQTASAASGGSLRPPGGERLPSGSASAQYNAAFGLLRRADYPAAEDALRSFIEQHPRDPLAGNAQYWLGESFYARGKYAEAAAAFADGYKRYPRGPKAADGLLQLGMSLARADQKHNACIALMQLDHDFPHAGSAVKSRATQEKKRLGC
ncbi:MAG TPA: tol-pal system protein YbgF [Stellaceae bacterium]|jgi:tol-pal system protein YbgF